MGSSPAGQQLLSLLLLGVVLLVVVLQTVPGVRARSAAAAVVRVLDGPAPTTA